MKINSRSNHQTYIHLKLTEVRFVPQSNITNTSVFFYTWQLYGKSYIDVTFYSQNFNNNDRRQFTRFRGKSFGYFDQSQYFEINGSYSKGLDLSSNNFHELPTINQLDVRELDLCFNRIRQLNDSTNLTTAIEVNRTR